MPTQTSPGPAQSWISHLCSQGTASGATLNLEASAILGFYRENGKENGNYYSIFGLYIWVIGSIKHIPIKPRRSGAAEFEANAQVQAVFLVNPDE